MAPPANTDLARAIRGRVEHLVDDLVASIVERVEGVIDDAIEVARSAAESELAQTGRASGLDVPGTTGVAHRDVKPPNLILPPSVGLGGRARTRKPNTCGTCGAVGFTSAGCGKTHNVPSAPAGGARVDAAEVEVVAPPLASPSRQSRPPAPSEPDDEPDDDEEKTESPPPVTRVADKRDRFAAIEESAARRRGELPVPRSTFTLE